MRVKCGMKGVDEKSELSTIDLNWSQFLSQLSSFAFPMDSVSYRLCADCDQGYLAAAIANF
jgi:hypothetical protein